MIQNTTSYTLTKFYGGASFLFSPGRPFPQSPDFLNCCKGGVAFVMIAFSSELTLYANYLLKPTRKSCQPISNQANHYDRPVSWM